MTCAGTERAEPQARDFSFVMSRMRIDFVKINNYCVLDSDLMPLAFRDKISFSLLNGVLAKPFSSRLCSHQICLRID